jgi:hypothetical protein
MRDGNTTVRLGAGGLLPGTRGWAAEAGTSFAAPVVASLAADLFDHYVGAPANLVKALLVHFTTSAIAPSIGIPEAHLIGFGEPDVERAKWSRSAAVTYLHTGTLYTAQHVDVPFHVPSCFVDGTPHKMRIRVTVVIDPPVSVDNQLEYLQCRVSAAVLKPAQIGHTRAGANQDETVEEKWSCIEAFQRVYHRSYPSGTWVLRLRLWSRGREAPSEQRFATVIEVIDDSGALPVRETAQYEAGANYTLVQVQAVA